MSFVSADAWRSWRPIVAAQVTALELRRALKVMERLAEERGITMRTMAEHDPLKSALRQACVEAIQSAGVEIDAARAKSLYYRSLTLAQHPDLTGHSDDICHPVYEAVASYQAKSLFDFVGPRKGLTAVIATVAAAEAV